MAYLRYLRRILGVYLLAPGKSNISFWHTPLAVNPLTQADVVGLRLYPMDFSAKLSYTGPFDIDGIPVLDYRGSLGIQYNPNAIAQFALARHDQYVAQGTPESKDAFLRQASWFLRSGKRVQDDILLWEYDFDFEWRTTLRKPWRSALAQGQALSVLLRAHQASSREEFLSAAHRGFNAFRRDIRHEGGVIFRDGDSVWLEELIMQPPTHVLNGFIWALWGVRDYAVYTKDPYARKLHDDCVRTLLRHLPDYDVGFWTLYDSLPAYSLAAPRMPVSRYYQRLHSVQMEAMHRLTGEAAFARYARQWESYLRNPFASALGQLWKIFFKLTRW